MNDHCPGCPFPEGVFCYALQMVCDRIHEPEVRRKFLENLAITTGAIDASEPPPPLDETLILLKRMHDCPDREPRTDCGCAGLATCKAGKGSDGLVNHHDCFQCLRETQ